MTNEFEQLSECCDGNIIWLFCESTKCDNIHQFALCEICGETIYDEDPECIEETEKENER